MAFFALMFLPAQADDVSLGYCDGATIGQRVDRETTTSVAVRFADTDFSMYHGSRIIGVRIGAGSDMPQGVTVFVRDSLTGTDLYTMRTPPLYQGWNDVTFDQPVDYPAADLVVGYTMAAGKVGLSGEAWTDGCWMLGGGAWKDCSNEQGSSLCIQALLDGESYGVNDAALLRIGWATAGKGTRFSFDGRLRNNTNTDIDHVAITYTIGGVTKEQEVSFESILPGEIGAFSVEAEAPATPGDYTISTTISSVNGLADEFEANNTATAQLSVVGELVKKMVLVENFTTQTCVNCPAAHTRLADALKGRDDYLLVAHHYGNGTDNLTAFGSSDLQWFYNSNTMYAPAMMIDRVNLMDEPGPISFVPESATIAAMLDEESAKVAPVAISLLRYYDSASRTVRIRVNTHVVEGQEVGADPVVSVLLLEDGIIAAQSPGYENYQHDHVCRRFVTPVYGDAMTFVGSEEQHCDYTETIPETWNPENMHIVAFVSNYNQDDCNDCHVYNATSVTLDGQDDIETGIVEHLSSAVASSRPVAEYNLSGQRVATNVGAKGIYIVRMSDGAVRKVLSSKR